MTLKTLWEPWAHPPTPPMKHTHKERHMHPVDHWLCLSFLTLMCCGNAQSQWGPTTDYFRPSAIQGSERPHQATGRGHRFLERTSMCPVPKSSLLKWGAHEGTALDLNSCLERWLHFETCWHIQYIATALKGFPPPVLMLLNIIVSNECLKLATQIALSAEKQ